MSAIADSLTADGLTLETVLELSRRDDPVGVLSIYLDARPGDGLRTASIDIKNRLSDLERRLASDGSPERAHAIRDGIAWLAPELERLFDPEEPGRGRILFAAMSGAWTTRISSQLPLPNRVVLDRSAFIHPLLELLDEGAPVGVVLASRTEARLLEWRFGELTERRELRAAVLKPPYERSGPVGSRPTSRYSTPTGEQRGARERDQTTRFIDRVAVTASSLADEHQWKRVLISGGEHLTEALIRRLPAALRQAVIRDPRVLVALELSALEEIVTERVRAARDESQRRLIRKVREQAHGAGDTALGLSQVLGALNQARVAHLIYDPVIRYRGLVGHDGSLYAEGEAGPARVWTADPRLTERIVERALETGARVTPIEGAASDGLADASGIAAVLRW